MAYRIPLTGLAFGLTAIASPATAELPAPVRAMIDAAVATGDAAKVKTVVDLAKQTNPDDVVEIDALNRVFLDRQREIASEAAARKQEELRTAGLLDNWRGRGQLGAFQSSGNSDNVGVTLSLALTRKGIDWEHRLRATGDYQRSNGRTSREQLLASWEPRYQIGKNLFAFSLAQYERDRFQGFSARYSLSGGIGYKLIDGTAAQLAVKVGPSWRQVEFLDGTSDNAFGALAGVDFDWRFAKGLTLTQDTNLVADIANIRGRVFSSRQGTRVRAVSPRRGRYRSNWCGVRARCRLNDRERRRRARRTSDGLCQSRRSGPTAVRRAGHLR
jgi:putative salt-induced outer membrane protein